MRTSEDLQQELNTQPQPSETLTVVNLGELPEGLPTSLAHPKLKADEITLEQLRAWEENSDLESVSVASQLLVERNADLMKENIELELAKQQQAVELAQLKVQLEKIQAAQKEAEEMAAKETAVRLKEQATAEAALKEEVERLRIAEVLRKKKRNNSFAIAATAYADEACRAPKRATAGVYF